MFELTILGFSYFLGVLTGVGLIMFALYIKNEIK